MQVRYHELRGKRVRTSDGHKLGRVTDLVAERRGDAMSVVALLVGPSGFLRRMGFLHSPLMRAVPARHVPWRFVNGIDREIHLAIDLADLNDQERGQEDGQSSGEERTI